MNRLKLIYGWFFKKRWSFLFWAMWLPAVYLAFSGYTFSGFVFFCLWLLSLGVQGTLRTWNTDQRIAKLHENTTDDELIELAYDRTVELESRGLKDPDRVLLVSLWLRLADNRDKLKFQKERNDRIESRLEQIQGQIDAANGRRGPSLIV